MAGKRLGGLEYGSDDRRGGRSDRKGRRDKREHERDRDRGLEDDGAGPFASRFQNLSDVAGQVIRGCLLCHRLGRVMSASLLVRKHQPLRLGRLYDEGSYVWVDSAECTRCTFAWPAVRSRFLGRI